MFYLRSFRCMVIAYSVIGGTVAAGDYTLKVKTPGHREFVIQAPVRGNTAVNAELQPARTATIKVLDEKGQPAKKMEVVLFCREKAQAPAEHNGIVDDQGIAVIKELPECEADLLVFDGTRVAYAERITIDKDIKEKGLVP